MSLPFFDKQLPLAVNEKTGRRLIHAMKRKSLVAFARKHSLRVEHFLGEPLLQAARHGYLDQVAEALKVSGGRFTPEHFLAETARVNSPLTTARLHGNLHQVFAPALWLGRVGEMERLWSHVNPLYCNWIGYEALRNQTILMSVQAAEKIPLSDFQEARRGGAARMEAAGVPQSKGRV